MCENINYGMNLDVKFTEIKSVSFFCDSHPEIKFTLLGNELINMNNKDYHLYFQFFNRFDEYRASLFFTNDADENDSIIFKDAISNKTQDFQSISDNILSQIKTNEIINGWIIENLNKIASELLEKRRQEGQEQGQGQGQEQEQEQEQGQGEGQGQGDGHNGGKKKSKRIKKSKRKKSRKHRKSRKSRKSKRRY
jgi:hypothetical protein